MHSYKYFPNEETEGQGGYVIYLHFQSWLTAWLGFPARSDSKCHHLAQICHMASLHCVAGDTDAHTAGQGAAGVGG